MSLLMRFTPEQVELTLFTHALGELILFIHAMGVLIRSGVT
jgi:hypothetical protein